MESRWEKRIKIILQSFIVAYNSSFGLFKNGWLSYDGHNQNYLFHIKHKDHFESFLYSTLRSDDITGNTTKYLWTYKNDT